MSLCAKCRNPSGSITQTVIGGYEILNPLDEKKNIKRIVPWEFSLCETCLSETYRDFLGDEIKDNRRLLYQSITFFIIGFGTAFLSGEFGLLVNAPGIVKLLVVIIALMGMFGTILFGSLLAHYSIQAWRFRKGRIFSQNMIEKSFKKWSSDTISLLSKPHDHDSVGVPPGFERVASLCAAEKGWTMGLKVIAIDQTQAKGISKVPDGWKGAPQHIWSADRAS